ncbi:MAG TPA: helix-turn-helix domain-containing protein [Solirubrobacteraceae bacterium]|nr:helix-turn-helix domain-containing protein [Solirubrobacteraceae bacterium]
MAVPASRPADPAEPLAGAERRPRADAARNRERLLAAASELFRLHGLDVAVSEIAERAGVGRATLFRNFPTKNDLVIAVILERMRESIANGRTMLERGEPRGRLLETLIAPLAEGQQMDRALFEAVGVEEFISSPDVQAVHRELLETVDALLAADHAAGTVRGDIGAYDVLMLIKGACKVTMDLGGDEGRRALARQITLIRSAISAEAADACPFTDAPLSFADVDRAHRAGRCA